MAIIFLIGFIIGLIILYALERPLIKCLLEGSIVGVIFVALLMLEQAI